MPQGIGYPGREALFRELLMNLMKSTGSGLGFQMDQSGQPIIGENGFGPDVGPGGMANTGPGNVPGGRLWQQLVQSGAFRGPQGQLWMRQFQRLLGGSQAYPRPGYGGPQFYGPNSVLKTELPGGGGTGRPESLMGFLPQNNQAARTLPMQYPQGAHSKASFFFPGSSYGGGPGSPRASSLSDAIRRRRGGFF